MHAGVLVPSSATGYFLGTPLAWDGGRSSTPVKLAERLSYGVVSRRRVQYNSTVTSATYVQRDGGSLCGDHLEAAVGFFLFKNIVILCLYRRNAVLYRMSITTEVKSKVPGRAATAGATTSNVRRNSRRRGDERKQCFRRRNQR